MSPQHLAESSRIGVDATLFTASDASTLSKSLAPRNSTLAPLANNLIDLVWDTARPERPKNSVFHLAEKYSGESHTSKIDRLRTDLSAKNSKAIVLTALDEIAWLFNLRGSDIAYNPVFFAYAVVTLDSATLFVQGDAFKDGGVRAALGEDVQARDYEEIWEYLRNLGTEVCGCSPHYEVKF